MPQPTLTQINIHPLKSAAPVALQHSEVTSRGLAHDRRWMVVDGAGQGLTAREYPALLKINPLISYQGIRFLVDNNPVLDVEAPTPDAQKAAVFVFDSPVMASLAGGQAEQWFSDYLGIKCRLVFMRDEDARIVDESANGHPGDTVSFADQHPLLLIGETSLAALNQRLETPVSMRNFRPNLVIAGAQSFAEDEWETIYIGKAGFRVAQACQRCVLTTIDPVSAQPRPDKEPLKTLARFRRNPKGNGVIFGVHLAPIAPFDSVSLGDTVTI